MKDNKLSMFSIKPLRYIIWKINDIKKFVIYRYLAEYHIVGFPKSGNTWVKFFLANYISKYYRISLDLDFDRHIFRESKKTPRVYFSHIGSIPGHQAGIIPEINISNTVNKTINQLSGKKVVFLYRDPRDVVISFYFHLKKYKNNESISEFIRNPNTGVDIIIGYMNQWYENRRKFESFEIFGYEKRVESPELEFKRMLNSMNVPVDEKLLKEVTDFSDFKNMKKIEQNKLIKHKTFMSGDINDSESPRMRKGKIGGYKDYLNNGDIKYVDDCMKSLNKQFSGISR